MKIMSKGKASLSSSGASMSKYDVEVEARLKALEKIAHENCSDGGGGDSETVRIIEAVLRKIHPNWDKLVGKEKAGG